MTKTMYYIGGPLDLTKHVMTEVPPPNEILVQSPSELRPYVRCPRPGMEQTEEVHRCRYVVTQHTANKDVYIAFYIGEA